MSAPTSGYGAAAPLRAYAALSTAHAAAFAGALATARSHGSDLRSPTAWDVLTIGIATHKLSRLIAKDRITSFLRAPFTRYEGPAGEGEVDERPRGTGLRRATGELLVCPYCLGQWVVAGFAVTYVTAPRVTRLVATMYTSYAIADFLQLGYRAAENAASH